MELRDQLRIIARRWYVVLGVAVVVGAILFLMTPTPPVRYRAQADFVLRTGSVYVGFDKVGYFVPTYTKAAHAELVKWRGTLEEAVRGPLSKYYPDAAEEPVLTAAVESLRGRFAAEISENTEKITLSCVDDDSAAAVDIVNGVAEAYKAFMAREERAKFASTIRFTNERVEALSERIRVKREELAGKGRSPAEMPSTVAEKAALDLIRDLNRRILEAKNRRTDLEVEIAKLNRVAAARGEELPADVERMGSDRIWGQILESESELERMRGEYTETHPKIAKVKERIEGLRIAHGKVVEEELNRGQFKALAALMAEIRAKVAERGALERKLAELEARHQEANEAYITILESGRSPQDQEILKQEAERERLRAEIESLRGQVAGLETLRNEFTASQEMAVGPVGNIRRAETALPVSAPRTRSMLLMAALALILGVACAWLMEMLNTTVRTEHDVRRYVNLPLLGTILRIRNEAERLLVQVAPQSPLGEMFQTTATLVESQLAAEPGPRSLLIASSNPEEGKSTIAANLGVALARAGARVVLVDADLRKAVLHRFLDLDNEKGLSTYLSAGDPAGLDEVLRPTSVENLSAITAGPHHRSPAPLLKSEAMRDLLAELKRRFDFVIVDVPPVRIAADTLVLAPQVDGVILLVSAGETRKDDATYTKRLLESARGKLVGTILNKVTVQSRGYYYYYRYYDYGYRYYGYYGRSE